MTNNEMNSVDPLLMLARIEAIEARIKYLEKQIHCLECGMPITKRNVTLDGFI